MHMDILVSALYSAAVSGSQVISKTIPLTVADTNVIRTSVVGAACIAYLVAAPGAPVISEIPAWVTGLSVLSGVIMFGAAITYIALLRRYGIVSASINTTGFSFVFAAVAGAALGEPVTARSLVAMAVVMSGIILNKCAP